jgi:hypothetical protein
MDARGNTVRASILRTRAAEGANLTLAGARAEFARLAERLERALELTASEAEDWRRALLPLLARSARGLWSQEARFLYDLQKVCVDSERGIFAVDLVEWAITWGRRPIVRPLPNHREVAIVRHLRRAFDRLRYVHLLENDRSRLVHLLRHAVEEREQRLRKVFRPTIEKAMQEAGIAPENIPEKLAQGKLIEELLDRTVEYGHFNMGNLRDALSRNQLKMPDLESPVEMLTGDPLIRLNRKLGESLEGVYRRGEIYMRWLHRLSSLFFGTVVGRFLMLYLILPFGLGFVVMVAPGLLVEEGEKFGRWMGLVDPAPSFADPAGTAGDPALGAETANAGAAPNEGDGQPDFQSGSKHHKHRHRPLEMPNLWGWAAVGIFFLLVFHVGAFRNNLFYGIGQVGRGLQTVFIHGPLWIMHRPLLQAFLRNRVWVRFRRCVLWPCALGGVGYLFGWFNDLDPQSTFSYAALLFLSGIVLLNTRLGRDVEEELTDMLVRLWLWCSVDFVPGLFRLIMDVSRWFLEGVDQVLYTVDEWLRFRSGDSRLSQGAKAILGVIWFAITYIVRIYANLLIEPTVNPIKHFPVVTIGHKIMLPFIIILYHFLHEQVGLQSLGPVIGTGFIVVTLFFLPGICGFVVWELKANWKLYRANRPANLKPVMIGSHGETMRRLLRPGFHSGTVPKLYRRLRKAERRAQAETVRSVLAALHHVEESVAHFIEREMLAVLRQSQGWEGLPIEVGDVHLATNCVQVALACTALDRRPLILSFDYRSDWLLAGVLEQGWLPKLSPGRRRTLVSALAGLYKMAGVDVTREQIVESLAPVKVAYDITPEGLEVWLEPDFTCSAIYELNSGPVLEARSTNGIPLKALPALDTSRLLFANVPVSWQDWVRTWARDRGLVNGDRRELAVALLPSN